MKKEYKLSLRSVYLAGCLGVCLGACTTGEEPVGEGQPLEIAASITPATRAASDYDKTAFADGDKINVGTSATAVNTTYQYKAADDRWLPLSGVGLTTTGASTTFYAAYPIDFTKISDDQTTVDKYKQSNQLKADKTVTGNFVQFSFSPAAAKITLSVIYSDETHEGINATVKGVGLIDNSNSQQTITLYKVKGTGKTHTYVGIVYPVTSKEYVITVNSKQTTDSSNDVRSHTQSSKTLKAGYNYIYNFSSSNDFILNGIQVKPFNEKGTAEVGSAT